MTALQQANSYIYAQHQNRMIVKAVDKGAVTYARLVRGAVYGLWADKIDTNDFLESMYINIADGFRAAWYEGAAQAGIQPEELTIGELGALAHEIDSEYNYVQTFADAISSGSKANGEKLAVQMKRAQVWMNRYGQVRDLARRMAASDQKMKWIRSASDSCSSCLRLDGRIYRASTWKRYDIYPRHPRLACMASAHGVPVCKCELVITQDRCTPGVPPRI